MKKSNSFLGIIKNGELKVHNVDMLKETIRKHNDTVVELVLRVVVDKRSNEQNSYYWAGLVAPIKEGLKDLWGEDVTLLEAHDLLRNRFCSSERWNDTTGEYIKIPRSTTSLSISDFVEYCEKCRLFAIEELSIEIKDYEPVIFKQNDSENGI